MKHKWILEHLDNLEIHNSLVSIERKGLYFIKETKDGIKNCKITSRIISKSVRNFGYYSDENYKIYKSKLINNK